jgi:hypothetical protein
MSKIHLLEDEPTLKPLFKAKYSCERSSNKLKLVRLLSAIFTKWCGSTVMFDTRFRSSDIDGNRIDLAGVIKTAGPTDLWNVLAQTIDLG